MKFVFLLISILVASLGKPEHARGQGLDSVVVEKYYISDNADMSAAGNILPVGSITYRIFVFMKPGYKLQAVFGSEQHPLIISTDRQIYNHPNYGNYIPNLIPDYSLPYNTVMLDSWISMGAASMGGFGIPGYLDDTAGTIKNKYIPQVLQGSGQASAFPVKERDGLNFSCGKPPRVTVLGLDSLLQDLNKINAGNDSSGYSFATINGAWACLEGAVNKTCMPNVIIIGQITTAGKLHFEFNIQLGTPDGKVERYVHSKPSVGEIQSQYLIYHSTDHR